MSDVAVPRYPYVRIDLAAAQAESMSKRLWELGALGVEERDHTTMDAGSADGVTLIGHFATECEAEAAVEALDSLVSASVGFVVGDEWRDGWKKFFKPTSVGARLLVRPSWEPIPVGESRIVLTLDPGNAFGSGTHETTRLCLEVLEREIAGGESVLDVGCGSGILGIAAAQLGASVVVAIDIEEESMRATLENAAFNGVEARVHASLTPLCDIHDAFDVVVANIRATTLVELSADLLQRARGLLILSGILAQEEDEVVSGFAMLGVPAISRAGEWIALTYRLQS